jgi:hypothetical protein
MANKKAILEDLANFFAEQGKVLSPSEYKALSDIAPIRYHAARRPFGSWARIQQMIKFNFPDQWAKANSESVPTPVVEKAPAAKAAPKKAKK